MLLLNDKLIKKLIVFGLVIGIFFSSCDVLMQVANDTLKTDNPLTRKQVSAGSRCLAGKTIVAIKPLCRRRCKNGSGEEPSYFRITPDAR